MMSSTESTSDGCPNPWYQEVLAVLAPALVVVVSPALDLLRRNQEVLGFSLSMTRGLFALAACMVLVGTLAAALRHRSWIFRFLYLAYLALAPIWMVYLAAAKSFGKGRTFLVSMIVLTLLAALTAWRRSRVPNSWVQGVALLAALMSIPIALDAMGLAREIGTSERHRAVPTGREPSAAPLPGQGARLGQRPNVYHVVFDEFQAEMFQSVLTDDVARELGGFVFFDNVSTPYGRTEMALGATFSGRAYEYRGEPYDYVYRAFHDDQTILSTVETAGYQTEGLIHGVYPRRAESPFHSTTLHKENAEVGSDVEIGSLFFSLWTVASFPRRIAMAVVPAATLQRLESRTLLPTSDPYYSVLSFRNYISGEYLQRDPSGSPKYFFAHLIVPHFPLVLGSDCRFRGEEGTIAEMQSACAVRLMTELVSKLEATDQFDDALILFHGDHGASYHTEGGELVGSTLFSPEWHVARSRPMLLVKPPGARSGERLRTDSRPADLYDIYPTIADALGESTAGIGRSLLRDSWVPRERFYHFYSKDDQHRDRMIDGPIARYVVTADGLEFDTEVEIDRPPAADGGLKPAS